VRKGEYAKGGGKHLLNSLLWKGWDWRISNLKKKYKKSSMEQKENGSNERFVKRDHGTQGGGRRVKRSQVLGER